MIENVGRHCQKKLIEIILNWSKWSMNWSKWSRMLVDIVKNNLFEMLLNWSKWSKNWSKWSKKLVDIVKKVDRNSFKMVYVKLSKIWSKSTIAH
jgi:hypothetical protein